MHTLQPKHSKLKKEEIEKFLSKFNISLSQLPKISKKDPIVLNLNVEIGEVIKIERKGDEGGEYFRVVV